MERQKMIQKVKNFQSILILRFDFWLEENGLVFS